MEQSHHLPSKRVDPTGQNLLLDRELHVGDRILLVDDAAWGRCEGTVVAVRMQEMSEESRSMCISETHIEVFDAEWETPEGKVVVHGLHMPFDNRILAIPSEFERRFDNLKEDERVALLLRGQPAHWGNRRWKHALFSLSCRRCITGKDQFTAEADEATEYLRALTDEPQPTR